MQLAVMGPAGDIVVAEVALLAEVAAELAAEFPGPAALSAGAASTRFVLLSAAAAADGGCFSCEQPATAAIASMTNPTNHRARDHAVQPMKSILVVNVQPCQGRESAADYSQTARIRKARLLDRLRTRGISFSLAGGVAPLGSIAARVP
jgi:hypothetical protein